MHQQVLLRTFSVKLETRTLLALLMKGFGIHSLCNQIKLVHHLPSLWGMDFVSLEFLLSLLRNYSAFKDSWLELKMNQGLGSVPFYLKSRVQVKASKWSHIHMWITHGSFILADQHGKQLVKFNRIYKLKRILSSQKKIYILHSER